jgi:hypothetical protein
MATSYNGQLKALQSDLIAKGREEAAAFRPPSDATRMDRHEVELKAEAEKFISDESQNLTGALTETLRSAANLQQQVVEIDGKIQQSLADTSLRGTVTAEMAEERQALARATEHRVRSEVDLRIFRARHGITTAAQYPESHVWHFGIILSLALVETVINAFFYENAQGLVGGFMVALGVSAINMAGAFVLGLFFRQKNLIGQLNQLWGYGSLILFVILAIYCNALFAAFRSEYQLLLDPTDTNQVRTAFTAASEKAAQVFLVRMDFGDLMSFILFGIGILLSLFAFYKGYTYDDPYPDHGRLDRAVKAAKEIELNEQAKLRERIKNIFRAKRASIQGLINEPAQLISQAGARKAALQHALGSCVTSQEAVQRDFELCLRSYRDANAAIRGTTPPVHFKDVPNIQMMPTSHQIDDVIAQLHAVEQAARAQRDGYMHQLNEQLNNIHTESAEILSTWFDNFVREVEQHAEDTINRGVQTAQDRVGV